MIYVLIPTRHELSPMLGRLSGRSAARIGRKDAQRGKISGMQVTLIESGIGQANTAQAVTAAFETGGPGLVILGGCAGAYIGTGLSVGDVAVATRETYADTGVITEDGWLGLKDAGLPLFAPGAPGQPVYETLDVASGMLEILKSAADAAELRPGQAGRAPSVHFGPLLTVSAVSGSGHRGEELCARHGAIAENMEGAAAAQVAHIYGAGFVEARGISNMVEDRDRDAWDIEIASENCAAFIEKFIGLLGPAGGETGK